MIGRLRGMAEGDPLGGEWVLDVQGVGYEVTTPLGTLGRLSPDDDGRVTLHVHTNVREDALELYGFASPTERAAFRTLIGINKVGPKLALNILSAMTVEDLMVAVERQQGATLTRIPGVGKKTAERMLLELSDKLPALGVGSAPRGGTAGGPPRAMRASSGPSGPAGVVIDALVRMGFKPAAAERAVAGLDDLDRPLAELIREALTVVSA
ncbi:MAG: Holliday junction branch migration protein RuvA [Myxococcota bacterium]